MLFSSITFLYFFLPAVVIIYTLAPSKLKNTILLGASLFFYAWGENKLVIMLIATMFSGWLFGLLIEKYSRWSKLLMALSVVISLSVLAYFKYADFFIDSFNKIFDGSIPLLNVALPIGISFYTFQILSYTVDVYRKKVPAQRNFVDFATYVALFPQLIAGPIVRYSDIEGQLRGRSHSVDKTSEGVRRFIIGLGKKVLIANLIGEICVNFRASGDLSVLYYWMYAIAFALQIYYDFSGYSDMAIGLGKIFGFDLMENFNYPYISRSITEFWRRWHISLGSWFRDYVYIPLGGNRKGLPRQLINILIVWALTGLWHGAAWNFVLWGLFFAVLLTLEKLFLLKWLESHSVICHAYTLAMVVAGFVLFNAGDIGQAIGDLAGMAGVCGTAGMAGLCGTAGMAGLRKLPLVSAEAIYYLKSYGIVYMAGIIGATPLPMKIFNKAAGTRLALMEGILLGILLLIVTAYLIDGSFNPFLYFRF